MYKAFLIFLKKGYNQKMQNKLHRKLHKNAQKFAHFFANKQCKKLHNNCKNAQTLGDKKGTFSATSSIIGRDYVS